MNTKNYNCWLAVCFVVLFLVFLSNTGFTQCLDDTVYIWYGNLDGSPLNVFLNQISKIDSWIQCTESAYGGDILLILGTDDQYISELVSHIHGWYGYPFTEWDDASFLNSVDSSPPNPEGWHSQAFAGWADLGGDPNPWLHFETPTKCLQWAVIIADSMNIVGDTVECIREGIGGMT